MPIRYRLTDSHGKALSEADSIGYLRGLVADFESGHYAVDEVITAPDATTPTTRRWGTIFKLVEGTIIVEPERE
jgi:hypothetical protein